MGSTSLWKLTAGAAVTVAPKQEIPNSVSWKARVKFLVYTGTLVLRGVLIGQGTRIDTLDPPGPI